MSSLSAPFRAVALLAPFALVAALALGVMGSGRSDAASAEVELTAEIARLRAASVAENGETPPSLDVALFWRGETELLALADMQGRIAALAQANAIVIDRLEATPGEPIASARRIDVRVESTLGYAELLAFVQSVEASVPAIRVERLDLYRGGDVSVDGGTRLSASMLLVGYAQ